jgi:hypothetical protein
MGEMDLGSTVSNEDYRENDGGPRLREDRHGSIKGCVEWGSVRRAIGLSSAWNEISTLSSAVPAAHIQEQSAVLCVAAW